jgi:hypothetical protein
LKCRAIFWPRRAAADFPRSELQLGQREGPALADILKAPEYAPGGGCVKALNYTKKHSFGAAIEPCADFYEREGVASLSVLTRAYSLIG